MLINMNKVEKSQIKPLFESENDLEGKKINQKIINTKKSLSKSLIYLLSKNSITEIDVSQLCTYAGVNRTTFYKHYNSLYDLLNELINEFFKKIEILFLKVNENENTTSKIAFLLKYLKQNREFVSVIMNNNTLTTISQRLITLDFIDSLIKTNIQYRKSVYINDNYYIDFIISGWYAVIKRWVNENCALDENTLARLLTSIY